MRLSILSLFFKCWDNAFFIASRLSTFKSCSFQSCGGTGEDSILKRRCEKNMSQQFDDACKHDPLTSVSIFSVNHIQQNHSRCQETSHRVWWLDPTEIVTQSLGFFVICLFCKWCIYHRTFYNLGLGVWKNNSSHSLWPDMSVMQMYFGNECLSKFFWYTYVIVLRGTSIK